MTDVSSSIFRPLVTALISSSVAILIAPGCGSSGTSGAGTTLTGEDAGLDATLDGAFVGKDCKGLACQVENCGAEPPTTITGTVFAPNGTLPLYNVVVYVPNAPLQALPEGPSCDRCGDVSGEPLVATLTDTNGKFELKNVPVGNDIPLVIQVGKWRREIKIPTVKRCSENALTDKTMTRLPKNQSEGHIPKMAVSTGLCDRLACLLPKLGLDPSEYTANTGPGRLHLYKGGTPVATGIPAPAPAGTPTAEKELWKDLDSLKRYDMVLLSCECEELNAQKPDSAKTALYDYAKLGGRVFASHFHYTWFQNSPIAELKSVAEWKGADPSGNAAGGLVSPFLVDQSFPKGKALAEWLVNVAASTTPGEIPINQPRADVVGVNAALATRWIYNKPAGLAETTKYLSFNTPVGAPIENQCGKVVFGDLHIMGENNTTLPDDNFPASCPQVLTPEEKALIFLFFDLSSCIQKEEEAPKPPIK